MKTTNPVDIACNLNVYFHSKIKSRRCSCSLEGGYSPFLWTINTFFNISNNLFDELSSADENI